MKFEKWQIVLAGLAAVAAVHLVSPSVAQESGTVTHSAAGWIDSLVHWTVRAIEIVGIATIVIGAVVAVGVYVHRAARGRAAAEYQNFRASLGRSILLGLEFLVAADIINTVAIDADPEQCCRAGRDRPGPDVSEFRARGRDRREVAMEKG